MVTTTQRQDNMEDNLKLHECIIYESLKSLRSRVPESEQKIIDGMNDQLKKMFKLAPNFDYKGYPVNGIRLAVKYMANCLEYISNDKRNQDVKNFIPILHSLASWMNTFDIIRDFFDEDGLFISTEENRAMAKQIIGRFCNEFDPKAFAAVHGEGYFLRYLPLRIPGLIHMYRFILLYFSDGLFDFMANLIKILYLSTRDVVSELSKRWHMMNVDMFSGLLGITSLRPSIMLTSAVQFLMSIRKPRVQAQEHIIDFERKYDIKVGTEGVKLEKLHLKQDRKVIFSILRDESSMNHHGKVLVWIHGGAFMGIDYLLYHNVLMKDLCNAIPGLTVLTVKYSFAPEKPFPHGLMDALDTYLWLTSGDAQVEEILGFKPQDIMISGDSSGGNFAVSLTVLINEIRLLDKNFKPVFPSSLILACPCVSVDETIYFSNIFATFDIILSVFVLNTVSRAYPPIRLRDINGNYSIVKSKDVPEDWLVKDEYEFIRSPFISPLDYDKLEDLSHIRMSVMALGFDPLLDSAIQVAKKWKSPVDVNFVAKSFHGVYVLHHFDATAKKAFDCYVEMIKKALSFTESKKQTSDVFAI